MTLSTKVDAVDQIKLSEVVDELDRWYPPALAEDWDSVGLIVGDLNAPVRRILVALDPVAEVIDEAVNWDADLVLTHHPLFLKPVHQVSTATYKGKLVHQLISAGCALMNAHTNADRAQGGVADALADVIGLTNCRPLVPAHGAPLDKFVVFVPEADTDRVHQAMAAAGGGNLGEYRDCSWRSLGTGTFTASDQADPHIGTPGLTSTVPEYRLEMVAARPLRARILAAMRQTHPYEEPAFDIIELAAFPTEQGLGKVGELVDPMTLHQFAQHVAAVLPATAQGIRVAGDLSDQVRTIAVLGGSGDSLFDAARASGADVYLTSDLRHHPASEAREIALLRGGKPYLVDTAHWASESVWLPVVAQRLRQWAGGQYDHGSQRVEVRVSQRRTDPWTAQFPSSSLPGTEEHSSNSDERQH